MQEWQQETEGNTVSIDPDLSREVGGQLQEMAELGDVDGICKIAERLPLESSERHELVRTARAFDFEAVMEIASALEQLAEA